MSTTLFQHSDGPDPWPLYRERLARWPVIWDADKGLWAIYRYADCLQVLSHPGMLIPAVPDEGLGPVARDIKSRLVRISNSPSHGPAREAAMLLFKNRAAVDIAPLLDLLLPPPGRPSTYDWVERVCKVLPVMHLLRGFGFSAADASYIQGQLPELLKLMQPVHDVEAAAALERVCGNVVPLVSQRVSVLAPGLTAEGHAYGVSNLIGLLIQSYDATFCSPGRPSPGGRPFSSCWLRPTEMGGGLRSRRPLISTGQITARCWDLAPASIIVWRRLIVRN